MLFRLLRHVITSSCLQKLESTITARSIDWYLGSWWVLLGPYSHRNAEFIRRYKQVIRQVQEQEESHTGVRLSGTSTICGMLQSMIPEAS